MTSGKQREVEEIDLKISGLKKMAAAAFLAVILGGCAMKEFSSTPLYSGSDVKFTGRVEDRVNLWPLAYWREPVGSVAWPLVSWGDGHFAFRPVYSQYSQGGGGDCNEYNLFWPIGQFDTRHGDYRFFPFFWGESFRGEPYFCLFPAVWWNKEFAGVMPFFWSRGGGGKGFCVFPLFWSEYKSPGDFWNTLFPLYYYESNKPGRGAKSSEEFWAFCGLAGYNRIDGKVTDHRFLPLYAWSRGEFYSLPYLRYRSGGKLKSRVLFGLAGCDSSAEGAYESSWAFPFYYHDEDRFVTPLFGKSGDESWLFPLYYKDGGDFVTPLYGRSGDADWCFPLYWRGKYTFGSLAYWRTLGEDGNIDSAFSLPLLSGYDRDCKTGDRILYVLMGFGGRIWNDRTGGASWVFPLYYKDSESFYTLFYGRNPRRSWLFPVYFDGEERTYITPLYGRNKTDGSDWLFPLFYRDSETFMTLLGGQSGDTSWMLPLYAKNGESINTIPFSCWNDPKTGKRGFFSLPLLSGASWATNSCESSWFALGGLLGATSDASGAQSREWAFPLYYRDASTFVSLPYGFDRACGTTNTFFAAGLVGFRNGMHEGGWLFPLFNYDKEKGFEEKSAWMDAAKLPADVKVWTEIETNKVWNAEKREWTDVENTVCKATPFHADWLKTHLLVSDNDRTFDARRSWSETNCYDMVLEHRLGNRLFFKREAERRVRFDLDSGAKTGDVDKGWQSLFGFVYWHDWNVDAMKGTSKRSHSVLWKLWDWEEENGDVALDIFPGFTYDAKTNGYSKTSFLWRFFRYERDPEKGASVDLFFLPVWR